MKNKNEELVSIIVRTKNEERWITSCLKSVFDQSYKNIEVILVDNKSTDKTVEKAKQFKVKLVMVEKYLPGYAINAGIKKAKGTYIVCLSAHCIPVNNKWLENLLRNFDDEKIAGVYGRQEPMSFSSDFDKRDLLITFGLDKRVQIKDSFFHNANSMIRRDIWKEVPFDDNITNIEDRIWAEQVLKKGYQIIYEPEASVFHYHGIHQDRNNERCRNVVKILENIYSENGKKKNRIDINHLNVVAIIPVKGQPLNVLKKSLLEYTIQQAKNSKYIKQVIVAPDDEKVGASAKELGADVPFIRDASYSAEYVDIEAVMKYSLEEIEASGVWPDIIVLLNITFPFREKGLIDEMIFELVDKGLDTVLPVKEEFNSCWIEEDEEYKRLDEGFIPRKFKNPILTDIKGLGCVTHSLFVREGKLFGSKVGMYKIKNKISFTEVREENDIELAEILMEKWEVKYHE
jgi:glycosyltransferase involved in cell wall biosynthesis